MVCINSKSQHYFLFELVVFQRILRIDVLYHFGGSKAKRHDLGACIILVGDHFSGHTFALVRACIILVIQIFLGFCFKNLDRIL